METVATERAVRKRGSRRRAPRRWAMRLSASAVLRAFFYAAIALAVIGLGAVDRFLFSLVAILLFGVWLAASLALPIQPHLARSYAFVNWAIAAILALAVVQIVPWPFPAMVNPAFSDPFLSIGRSATISINPSATLPAAFTLIVPLVAMSAGMLLHQNEIDAARFIRRGTIIGGAIIGVTLVQFMVLPDTLLIFRKIHYRDSFTASFVNRNTAATFCGIVLLMATVQALNNVSRQRGSGSARSALVSRSSWSDWALRLTVVVSAVGLALTKSRAGAAATVLPLLGVLALDGYAILQRQRLTLGLAGRIAAAAVALLASGALIFDQLLLRLESQGASSSRWCAYGEMLTAVGERPWLGIGLGGFETFYPMRRAAACGIYGGWEYLHSVYLEALLSGGVVLFGLMLVFVVRVARILLGGLRHRRSFRFIPLSAAAVLGLIALHSLLDFSVQIPAIAILTGAVIGSATPASLERRTSEREVQSVNN